MTDLQSFENVFYPPVGIAHITSDLAHLVGPKLKGRTKIVIKSSSQPNSHPHLGTVTTLMTCYALGEYFRDSFSIPVIFLFDALENSPGETITKDGLTYQRSLSDTVRDGVSLSERYLLSFHEIMSRLTRMTGIEYSVRSYREFQSLRLVRKTLLRILQSSDRFVPLVSPSEGRIHLRFPCPHCRYAEKAAAQTRVIQITQDQTVFICHCFQHGEYGATLSEHSADFVDANTPLRDILQGVLSIEDDLRNNTLTVMVDGADWSNVWALRVFCNGLLALGYREIPSRFFAPVITDWSGAKFSKSLYLQTGAYNYLPPGFIDFSQFNQVYGDTGFEKLWKEVRSWVREPKKFFRDYSVDYLKLILESQNEPGTPT